MKDGDQNKWKGKKSYTEENLCGEKKTSNETKSN